MFVETILSTVICLLPRASCHVFQRYVRFKSHFCVVSGISFKNTRDCGKDKHDASWIDSCVHADKILSPYLALSLSAQNVSFQSLQCGSGCFRVVDLKISYIVGITKKSYYYGDCFPLSKVCFLVSENSFLSPQQLIVVRCTN